MYTYTRRATLFLCSESSTKHSSGDTTPCRMTGVTPAILHGVVSPDRPQYSAEAVRRTGVHARVAVENLLGRGVQNRGFVLDEKPEVCHRRYTLVTFSGDLLGPLGSSSSQHELTPRIVLSKKHSSSRVTSGPTVQRIPEEAIATPHPEYSQAPWKGCPKSRLRPRREARSLPPGKADIRLHGKGNPNYHGARPVYRNM